jgi:UDP-N-acetylglucosamine--N-acetylmuramyl-(pentapeptide) pyrophosphoryl-undecaprenol N-acetylglucosamine transferase
MRVIFAGGGTGGHLFPGLAVAREFQRRDAMTEILFVGTDKGIEARVLPREGFPL